MRRVLLWGLLLISSNPQAEPLQMRWFAAAESPVEELATDPAIEPEPAAPPVAARPDYVGRLKSGKQQRVFLRFKGPQDSRVVSAIVDEPAPNPAPNPAQLLEKSP